MKKFYLYVLQVRKLAILEGGMHICCMAIIAHESIPIARFLY